jgi:hypothetical protein
MAQQAVACAGWSRRPAPAAGRSPAGACPSPRRCAGSVVRHRVSSRRLGQRKVGRPGDLEVLQSPGTSKRRRPSASMALASSVTWSPARASASLQQAQAEHLRRLRRPQALRGSVSSTRPSCSRLSVSATGSASRPPTSSPAQAVDQALDPLGPQQAARSVVHQHPVVVAAPRSRSLPGRCGHRLRARGAAQRASQRRSGPESGHQRSKWSSRGSDHQRGQDRGHGAQGLQRVRHQRPRPGRRTAWAAGAGPFAHAGTRHQRKAARSGAGGHGGCGLGMRGHRRRF